MRITQKHMDLINSIVAYTNEHKYPPSMRELGEMVGLTSTGNIHRHLGRLQQLGYIEWEPTKPRTLKVVRAV